MGYGELLADDITSAPVRSRLDKLVAEGRRMKKIVENLLRFSRQSASDRQSIDLRPIVQDVLALREYHVRTRDVEIEVDIQPNFPLVVADEDQCKQVLLNLINNAIDAVEDGKTPKRIGIRIFQRGGRAVIIVADTGPGFSDLNRAFDPFYTTKPVGRGTGLGLSICHGIVKEHGGEIRLENLQPRGAAVTIELPMGEGTFSNVDVEALPWGASRENTKAAVSGKYSALGMRESFERGMLRSILFCINRDASGFPIDIRDRQRPKWNQIDPRHELAQKRREEIPNASPGDAPLKLPLRSR